MALDLSTLSAEDLRALTTAIQKSHLQAAQDAMDEGARLHHEKNAPWAPGGTYEKVLQTLPPYVYREYPKMLFTADYVPACGAFDAAHKFRERRDEPGTRDDLIKRAERRKQDACRIVADAAEERACLESGLWANSPQAAVLQDEARQQAIAQAAAESAWDDRRLSSDALAERDAIDAESEGHLVEVPARRRPGRPRKVEP